jgi:DNA uptake protein ComE-like DNA-binding protein
VDLLLRLQAGGVQLSGPEDLQRVLELSDPQLRCWQPLLDFRWYGERAPERATPVDLNRASLNQLQGQLSLPPDVCGRLLRERGRGPFQDLADLQQRVQLSAQVVEALIGKVSFSRGPVGPDLPRPPRPSSAA